MIRHIGSWIGIIVAGAFLMTACSGSNQVAAWPRPAQLVARMKMMRSMEITMQDVVPGVAEQQPWSDYKGSSTADCYTTIYQ